MEDSSNYTHRQLVQKAALWLRSKGYSPIVTETVTNLKEIPDCIGWKNSKGSCLIECKVSKADFKQDAHKPSRSKSNLAIGQIRYYMAPVGIIPKEEIPAEWGLLEIDEKGAIKEIVKPLKQPFNVHRAANELVIAITLLRRAEIRGVKLNQTWEDLQKEKQAGQTNAYGRRKKYRRKRI